MKPERGETGTVDVLIDRLAAHGWEEAPERVRLRDRLAAILIDFFERIGGGR